MRLQQVIRPHPDESLPKSSLYSNAAFTESIINLECELNRPMRRLTVYLKCKRVDMTGLLIVRQMIMCWAEDAH